MPLDAVLIAAAVPFVISRPTVYHHRYLGHITQYPVAILASLDAPDHAPKKYSESAHDD